VICDRVIRARTRSRTSLLFFATRVIVRREHNILLYYHNVAGYNIIIYNTRTRASGVNEQQETEGSHSRSFTPVEYNITYFDITVPIQVYTQVRIYIYIFIDIYTHIHIIYIYIYI
jgi:hypothetical protein